MLSRRATAVAPKIAAPPRRTRRALRGASLIEALIATLILALGLLGLIKMQSHAVVTGRDAMYRAEAGLLAHGIIGIMWTDRANLANYGHRVSGADCAPSGADATSPNALNWMAEFTTAGATRYLPGATPAKQQIVVDMVAVPPIVRVQVCWRSPQDASDHSFVAVSQLPPS